MYYTVFGDGAHAQVSNLQYIKLISIGKTEPQRTIHSKTEHEVCHT